MISEMIWINFVSEVTDFLTFQHASLDATVQGAKLIDDGIVFMAQVRAMSNLISSLDGVMGWDLLLLNFGMQYACVLHDDIGNDMNQFMSWKLPIFWRSNLPHYKQLCSALNLLMESYSSHRCVRCLVSRLARFDICFLHLRRHVGEKVVLEAGACATWRVHKTFFTLPLFLHSTYVCTVHLQSSVGAFR